MPWGKLTTRQVKYAELVANGMDEKEAALEVGYSRNTIDQQLFKLRSNPKVADKIEYFKLHDGSITDNIGRQQVWSDMMNDPANSKSIRLKASELLGKAQGDFVMKQEVKTTGSQSVIVVPNLTPEQWEEYYGRTISK